MNSFHGHLQSATQDWHADVVTHFPLWKNFEISTKKEIPVSGDWRFCTDMKKAYALIMNDENLQKKFLQQVSKYWPEDSDKLAKEVLEYLLFHELYHPLEAPFSLEDNKLIEQAMMRGIVAAEPHLTPLQQEDKKKAGQNMVKDFILDNRLYLDNLANGFFSKDIIPVFDVTEMYNLPQSTDMYSITRCLYGVLYGPVSTHPFFAAKTGSQGVATAQQSLEALIQSPTEWTHTGSKLMDENKALDYARRIRQVFAGPERYKGVERFMRILGPHITTNMPKERQTNASPPDTTQENLQNSIEDMTPEQQTAHVQKIIEQIEGERKPETGAPDRNAKIIREIIDNPHEDVWDIIAKIDETKDKPQDEEHNKLEIAALHEFYKRNHPKVVIVGGHKVGQSTITGQREYLQLIKTSIITSEDLSRLNVAGIMKIQQKTGLPWLIPLQGGNFRLNEYEKRTRNIKDIQFLDPQIDVPDDVQLYLDSSGSMYKNAENTGFNDGTPWDMLSRVVYGMIDGLYQASKKAKKDPKLQIFNVANKQIASPITPVSKFWSGDSEVLRVLFKPKNGYDMENLNITPMKKPGTYIIVTDGNLTIEGRAEREAQKMSRLASEKENTVALFEIGGTYSLGKIVKQDKNIHYYPVHNMQDMLKNGLEVLLAKRVDGLTSQIITGGFL